MTYRQYPLHVSRADLPRLGIIGRILRIIADPPAAPVSVSIRRTCTNPPDPVDLRAAWLKRLADYQAKRDRRLQRIDLYMTQRTSRCQT